MYWKTMPNRNCGFIVIMCDILSDIKLFIICDIITKEKQYIKQYMAKTNVLYAVFFKYSIGFMYNFSVVVLDWIEQCFTSPPTQYRLYRRRFLQVKRPNQQY